MIPAKRQEQIAEILKREGSTAISELADKFNVSQMTIRRDIEILSEKNIATRNHGGVSLNQELRKERLYEIRVNENIEGKIKIAQMALAYIKPGYTLYLDAGTITFQLSILIKNIDNLTVITPDLRIALELCNSDAKVYILGGEVQRETGSVFGNLSSDFIKNIYVDIAFIGTSSVSTQFVIYTPTFEKSKLKHHFIQNSNKSVLLVDKNAFYGQSLFKICSVDILSHIITDKCFNALEIETLNSINDRPDFTICANLHK